MSATDLLFGACLCSTVVWEVCNVYNAGLVTLNEMKAKQEDIVKERERQIAISRAGEAHLGMDELPSKVRNSTIKQVRKKLICSFLNKYVARGEV